MTTPSGTLMTGATGVLGRALLARLWAQDGQRSFYLLVRDPRRAQRELASVLPGCSRMHLVRGDLESEGLGMDAPSRDRLYSCVDRVVHVAGSSDPSEPSHVCEALHVEGTRRVLELAEEVARRKALRRFDHVSCAFVAGAKSGLLSEADLGCAQSLTSPWERSKLEAERLVRSTELPWSIHRPSRLLPSRGSQWKGLSLCSRLLAPAMHRRRLGRLDVVPATWAARAIAALMSTEESTGRCFHLTAGAGRELPVLPALWSAYVASVGGEPPLRAWSFQLARHTSFAALYQDRDHATFDALLARRPHLELVGRRFDNRRTCELLHHLGVAPPPRL